MSTLILANQSYTLSPDAIAGALCAYYLLAPEDRETITVDNFNFSVSQIYDFLHHYRVYTSQPKDSLWTYSGSTTHYLWWIRQKYDFLYDAYIFTNWDFVQWFIIICNHFDVDFRYFTTGGPFMYIDRENKYFGISGYDLEIISPPPERLGIIPFTTGPPPAS